MSDSFFGRLIGGNNETMSASWDEFASLPVDQDLLAGNEPGPVNTTARTIERPVELSGRGTFAKKNTTAMRFEPYDGEGWWFFRSDLEDELPVKVSIRNVWTTGTIVSNIVLRAGGPHNYIRLVEHIASLRMGLGIDSLMVRIDSGDPPIFDDGSLGLVNALTSVGRRETGRRVKHVTVKEKVAYVGPHGGFLVLEPPMSGSGLTIDCAVSFPNAIGRQRIRFPVTKDWVRHGAVARTNTPYSKVLYCRTIGKLFADVRHLGYNNENVLIAGKRDYKNEPRLIYGGKSLEAVWHRAVLDLLAAIALIDQGTFVGRITSYKAGHRLDVAAIKQLYLQDILVQA